jgi:hypothetical protein
LYSFISKFYFFLIPDGIKFAGIEVSCEGKQNEQRRTKIFEQYVEFNLFVILLDFLMLGYDHPDDRYILRGSCGLEYELVGHAKSSNNYDNDYSYERRRVPAASQGSSLFSLIIFAGIAFVLFKFCCSNTGGTTG